MCQRGIWLQLAHRTLVPKVVKWGLGQAAGEAGLGAVGVVGLDGVYPVTIGHQRTGFVRTGEVSKARYPSTIQFTESSRRPRLGWNSLFYFVVMAVIFVE